MKRYRKLTTTIPIWPGGEIKVESEMVEHPHGEWVKRRDVEEIEKLGFGRVHCALCGADLSKGNHKPTCELNKGAVEEKELKCNCDEMVINHAYNWICPAHGYKKR